MDDSAQVLWIHGSLTRNVAVLPLVTLKSFEELFDLELVLKIGILEEVVGP